MNAPTEDNLGIKLDPPNKTDPEDNSQDLESCPLCNTELGSYYIDIDEKVSICNNIHCEYPYGHAEKEQADIDESEQKGINKFCIDSKETTLGKDKDVKPAVSWPSKQEFDLKEILQELKKFLGKVAVTAKNVGLFIAYASEIVDEKVEGISRLLTDWFQDLGDDMEFGCYEIKG